MVALTEEPPLVVAASAATGWSDFLGSLDLDPVDTIDPRRNGKFRSGPRILVRSDGSQTRSSAKRY